jgi:hypothetical protein
VEQLTIRRDLSPAVHFLSGVCCPAKQPLYGAVLDSTRMLKQLLSCSDICHAASQLMLVSLA